MEGPNSLRPKKARQLKSKVKSILIIFFGTKGIVHKEIILHTTVMFYAEFMHMCKYFAPNFGDKRTGCSIITTNHLALPSSPGNFFNKNTMIVIPHIPYLPDLAPCDFSVSPTENKTERLPFLHN
jgi:hypothetical protein